MDLQALTTTTQGINTDLQATRMAENKLIGIEEVSELRGMSPYLIRKGIRSGRFPVFQMTPGGKYLIDLQLFDKALAIEALSNLDRIADSDKPAEPEPEPPLGVGALEIEAFGRLVEEKLASQKVSEVEDAECDGFGEEVL